MNCGSGGGGGSCGCNGVRSVTDACASEGPEAWSLQSLGIGPDEATELAKRLTDGARPRAVYLNDNPLGDEGVRRLLEGLEHVPDLQAVNLTRTGLGDGSVEALERFASQLQGPCAVYLFANMFSAAASEQLMGAFRPGTLYIDKGAASSRSVIPNAHASAVRRAAIDY